jgi:hypothetical protein
MLDTIVTLFFDYVSRFDIFDQVKTRYSEEGRGYVLIYANNINDAVGIIQKMKQYEKFDLLYAQKNNAWTKNNTTGLIESYNPEISLVLHVGILHDDIMFTQTRLISNEVVSKQLENQSVLNLVQNSVQNSMQNPSMMPNQIIMTNQLPHYAIPVNGKQTIDELMIQVLEKVQLSTPSSLGRKLINLSKSYYDVFGRCFYILQFMSLTTINGFLALNNIDCMQHIKLPIMPQTVAASYNDNILINHLNEYNPSENFILLIHVRIKQNDGQMMIRNLSSRMTPIAKRQ